MDIIRLIKIGHSVSCIIPAKYFKAIQAKLGDYLMVSYLNNSIILDKIDFTDEIKNNLTKHRRVTHGPIQGESKES